MFSDSLLLQVTESMLNSSCNSNALDTCRDESKALALKLIAICSILAAGAAGISIPLIWKNRRGFLSKDSNVFVALKAFAAGVILATGFVHMLPDGSANLTSPCLAKHPWSKFPFSGFIAMCSALLTLVADFVGTQIFERNQAKKKAREGVSDDHGRDGSLDSVSESGVMPVERVVGKEGNGSLKGDEMHIVGMYAHADQHRHSHPRGQKCGNGVVVDVDRQKNHEDEDEGHGHGHSHGFGDGGESSGRHAVVSLVLELGIVSHSVIIGLSLGVSHSPCTIRPLVFALSFHQFFEGFALGGCISEAQFQNMKTLIMACFFALTTPSGVGVGIGLASFYRPDSSAALVTEGVLDSISAGILIYMSLVDLIAADFMSKKMRCNVRLQIASYLALFLGAAMMSSIAIWT